MDMPKVSIIITTFLPESKNYLDLTIKSIRNLNYPADKLDVILVGKKGYIPEFEGVRSMAPDLEKFANPVGVNFGMKAAHADSKYVMLLNDDVILTRDSLQNMVLSMPQGPCIMGCLSNCDNYYKYVLELGFMKENTAFILQKRYYKFEELEAYQDDLMNTGSYYPSGLILTDTLCMYANLIPKNLWDSLGGFDEGFGTGADDIDFCIRAKKLGAHMLIALNSLIFHFGGGSTNTTLTPEMREETQVYFHSKWGYRCDGK